MPLVGPLCDVSHHDVTQYPPGSALTVPKLQHQIDKGCPEAPSLSNMHMCGSALSAQFEIKTSLYQTHHLSRVTAA